MSRALPATWPAGLVFIWEASRVFSLTSIHSTPFRELVIVKIEHLAWNVEDPISVARWYVENLGFTIKRQIDAPPWIHFLADDSGTVMLELYGNPAIDVHGFADIPAMGLHLALVTDDIEADMARLTEAGGSPDGEINANESGDRLGMIRDPWGFCLQLVQRAVPMI